MDFIKRIQAATCFSSTTSLRSSFDDDQGTYSESDHEHAVISTFDLFSIGIGPSSSHTVGPMRAGNIFVADLLAAGLLPKVDRIRVALYGSLALTGEGHMTPSALLLGLESANVETVDTAYVPERFEQIKKDKKLFLGHQLPDGKGKEIAFDFDRDFKWEWGKKLPLHSNGMRLMVFDKEGYMLATNDLFSVGGGFVVNGALSINKAGSDSASAKDAGLGLSTETHGAHPSDLAENMYYKEIRREDAAGDRRTGQEIKPIGDAAGLLTSGADGGDALPPATSSTDEASSSGGAHGPQPRYPFRDAKSLLALCDKHNLTIAQVVYENEKSHGYTDDEIRDKLFRIWEVMDNSILEGVQAAPDSTLPGMDYLTVYAMAVNETNAAGGRIVTAPTNGAAGIIPAVLKYTVEFVSDDPERDILSFLLTAAAIGMLYKRGATISAAEGGCMAEVGVACSMAAGAFAACMGASPQTIEQAAEIGIEHNLGLTCDPIGGLVQAPCIERNALGAIKAISSANLALSGETGTQKVSLDDAIRAMRVTAQGMRNEFKETSLSGLATSVPLHIPVSVPDC
ncbi:L-serine dehydratase [Trichoderma asperellum]|uniref:L-serine dehydratase n=1 Tax=Trichoderma asperellum TaxID=101201 RepID=A0A6V8R2D8_TRIAP|nr:L-serine dehydratase [Trichoderma asperellum]